MSRKWVLSIRNKDSAWNFCWSLVIKEPKSLKRQSRCTERRLCQEHIPLSCVDRFPKLSWTSDNTEIGWKRRKCENCGAEWWAPVTVIAELHISIESVWSILMENFGTKGVGTNLLPKVVRNGQLQREEEVWTDRRVLSAGMWRRVAPLNNYHCENRKIIHLRWSLPNRGKRRRAKHLG